MKKQPLLGMFFGLFLLVVSLHHAFAQGERISGATPTPPTQAESERKSTELPTINTSVNPGRVAADLFEIRMRIRELLAINTLTDIFLNTKSNLLKAFSDAGTLNCDTEAEKLNDDLSNVQKSVNDWFAMSQALRTIAHVPNPFLSEWWQAATPQAKCKVLQNKTIQQNVMPNYQEAETLRKDNQAEIDRLTRELDKLYLNNNNTTINDVTRNLPWVVGIIALLAVSLMAILLYYDTTIQMEWVASGQITQFVTVMTIIIALMALGLTKILTEQVLGTLLGGVAGYVLAQGVGRAASRSTLHAAAAPPIISAIPVPPPITTARSATTAINTPVTIDLTTGAMGGAATSAALIGTPTNGSVLISGTTATFTPTHDFHGTANFQFTLTNAGGTSNPATATITVRPAG